MSDKSEGTQPVIKKPKKASVKGSAELKKEAGMLAGERFYVLTKSGVFVIPKAFLPQVLKGIQEIAER